MPRKYALNGSGYVMGSSDSTEFVLCSGPITLERYHVYEQCSMLCHCRVRSPISIKPKKKYLSCNYKKRSRYNEIVFSLLRQEYPSILTSGEMLSYPRGWNKPIPEVIHLWRHRMSTPNNLEKSRLLCVLDLFCTFLGKNEKNNQSPHWWRHEGIPSSCQIYATSTTRKASSWIANLGHLDGNPSSLPQVVLDSINLVITKKDLVITRKDLVITR